MRKVVLAMSLITLKEEQNDIFNMFHDGSFEKFRRVDHNIEFEVAIEYLAQVINPQYTYFQVTLKNCQRLVLDIWDMHETDDIATINDFAEVLEISCADIAPDDSIRVVCNGFSRCPGACLLFKCDALQVFDESGKAITVAALAAACQQYWDNFGKKKPM